MFCRHCGKDVKEGAKFCAYCGMAVPAAPAANTRPAEQHCASCGTVLKEGARFCPVCGAQVTSAAPVENTKAVKPVIAIAAFVLGIIVFLIIFLAVNNSNTGTYSSTPYAQQQTTPSVVQPNSTNNTPQTRQQTPTDNTQSDTQYVKTLTGKFIDSLIAQNEAETISCINITADEYNNSESISNLIKSLFTDSPLGFSAILGIVLEYEIKDSRINGNTAVVSVDFKNMTIRNQDIYLEKTNGKWLVNYKKFSGDLDVNLVASAIMLYFRLGL